MIINDTSIWIDHFRGLDGPLDEILGTGQEALHQFVLGELVLGGLPRNGDAAAMLGALKQAPTANPADVVAFSKWASLAGTGIGYVDCHLLVSAKMLPNGQLLTRDKALLAQAERLGIAYTPRT